MFIVIFANELFNFLPCNFTMIVSLFSFRNIFLIINILHYKYCIPSFDKNIIDVNNVLYLLFLYYIRFTITNNINFNDMILSVLLVLENIPIYVYPVFASFSYDKPYKKRHTFLYDNTNIN